MLLNHTTAHSTILQQHGSVYVHTDFDMNCISKLSRNGGWQRLLGTRMRTEGRRKLSDRSGSTRDRELLGTVPSQASPQGGPLGAGEAEGDLSAVALPP